MNQNLPFPSHGLRRLWSRAGSPSSGWPRSSVLSLLLLAFALLTPVASWGANKDSDGSYYSSWYKFKNDANTGVTFYIRAFKEEQCVKAESPSTYPPEFYMVMSNRQVTPTNPFIEIEIPLIRGGNDCYTTINLLSKTSSGGTETIPTLSCFQRDDSNKDNYSGTRVDLYKWVTKNTSYGVWRHHTTKTNQGSNSDMSVAVLRFYPTKQYYAKGICCIEVLQGWDWGGDGGAGNMSKYKYKTIDNSFEHDLDNLHTYHLYPTFSDETYEPEVKRNAPQQVTFTVKPGKGQSSSKKYVYNIDWGSSWADVEVTSGTNSYNASGTTFDDGLTYKWLAYSLEEMSFGTDHSGNSTPNVTACVFAGGPTVNTGTDTNIGWTYKNVTVGASSDVASISSIAFDKWSKKVTIEWTKNDGTQTNGSWGIYRTSSNGTRSYLGKVYYSTLTYTDTDQNLKYDETYTYEVSYLPGTGTDYTRDQLSYLNKWTNITLTRSFDFGAMKLEEKEINGKTNIVYTWSHEAITDASSSKTYKLYVQRSEDEGKNWSDVGSAVSITSNTTTGGTYNDANVVTHKPYYYRVKINVQGKDFFSEAKDFTISDGSKLTGFQASRGNYNNVVKLSWTVNQVGTNPTYFTLQRRPLGSANDADWTDIYTSNGTASNYSYDDNTAQPGSFNEYRLRIFDEYNGEKFEGTSMTADGFSIATGVVSGRITYGTGTAVKGVKVTLSATNADGKSIQSNKAIYLSGEASSGLALNTTNEEIKKILGNGKTFTVQFWMRPQGMKDGNGHILMDIARTFGLNVKTANSVPWLECMIANNTCYGLDFQLTDDVWQHVSVVYANGKLKAYSTIDGKSFKESKELNQSINETNLNGATALGIGNWQNLGASSRYEGYLDEFRIFSRALTLDEIKQNYNHTLNGSEEGLQVYYPFDEGMENQKVAYDFSKQNGIANGHHASAPIAVVGQGNVVPSEDQLSLMTYTDQNGNYMLRGIPFAGEGTSYTIRPTLGIHEFSPTMENRFFNQNSLNHSGVDFKDDSSFPVSGYVYYEHTEYPVEGAQLYVDGNVCAMDGKVITTDAEGYYKISVPIGDHHITVQKQGHTFVNDGRYPADPNNTGTKFNFNQDKTDLTFYDNTTVDVVGRVAGGVIQQNEPIGLHQGKANIGQAKITLEVPHYRFNVETIYSADSTSHDIMLASKDRTFQAVTDNVKSTATVGHSNDNESRTITILTDAETGEYAVKLPPVAYDVKKVEIINNKVTGITYFNSGDLSVLDASNTTEGKDSLVVDDNVQYFNYDLKRNYIYRSPAKITVTDLNNGSDFFGETTYNVTNADGSKSDVSLVSANGGYRFGYPIFVQENTYQFDYYGCEEYQFKETENAEPDIDQVPLQGVELTIQNQFAGTTSVSVGQNGDYGDGDIAESEDNVITLDNLGHATYTFTAGFPNIKYPHTLSLSAKYAINGVSKTLDPMEAIVFGVLPTGNNFTTAGPDEILYVLRDPPGSHSYAYVEKGTTFESETSNGGTWSSENELTTVSHLGFSETFLVGAIGLMKQTTVETVADLTVGLQVKEEGSSKAVKRHSVTTTQRIQTSEEDQFVGGNGDVFIGSGTNIIFGKMRKVQPYKDGEDWNVDMKAITCTGQQFSTDFFYTTQDIENSILPGYEDMINEILQDKETVVSANPAKPVYVSKLDPDDPNYGRSNIDTLAFGKDRAKNVWSEKNHTLDGPSYTAYFPADMEVISDTITWLNSQIKAWKQTLANNEKVKLETKNSGKLKNISFDSGVVIEKSYTEEDYDGTETENTFMMSVVAGFQTGVDINKTGVDITINTNTGGGHVYSHTEGNTQTKTMGFVLADEGEDDKHSVDYGMAGDGYGYVFFTRGGQTSCPYEDAEVTKYYQPGEVLSAATMKIQDPKIRAEKTIVSNIPADGTGEVTLLLSNDSEIGEDGFFDLSLVDGTNPDGLQFFMDGQPFASGRSIYLPADNNVTRKTIMVKKGKSNVNRYENVKLRIASQCQYDPAAAFPEIADTLAFTFEFASTCSDIALAVDNRTVNNMTGPSLALTISKYDLNQESLKGIKIQYMKGGNDWALAKEYVTNKNDVTDDKELLNTPEATFTLDMSNPVWSDGNYVFRAITVCNIDGSIVNNESNEITVVKDMAQPMLIAMPTPTNGILNAGDELSVTFNEDIQYGSLLRTANFYIRGQLNDREVSHDAAFQATGSAGASTDAAIDLADKSFAVNLWLNWNEAGSFVNHGSQDNNFDAAVDTEGHLVVKVAGKTYTSDTTIPKDKWNFVSLAMEQTENGAVLNAHAAYDASEVALFVGQLTDAYTGNGKFEVGKSVKGAIHEVTLWNEARAWAVAQSEMYTGKSPFTPALIGYWRMDEAHGTTAVDAARSRNMTLPGENAWHMENENHSLQLDGSDYVDLNISEIATDITQDYAVELWMRADKTQADDASILSMGNNGIDLRIAKSGALELEAKGTTYNVSTTDLRDNQWHHIALNVLKSTNGSATVYVDGSQIKQIPASSMPALANDNLLLGARRNINTEVIGDPGTFCQYLKGNFDEVRIWHSTMTSDMIRQNMYSRVNPTDYDGLVAYYPLEKRALDEYNQIVTSSTLADQAQDSKHTAQVLRRISGNLVEAVADWSSDEAMAMKLAPTTQNVDYSFVGSDRKILITLNETPARVEGCTLYFTVRSVRDLNGNLSDPVTWTAVVNRHQMEWSEDAVSIRKANAEAKSFEVDVRNASASTVNWNITGLPTWLSASVESGTLAAQSSKTVTFTVAASTAVGKYEQTIYVSGDDGVQMPLVVNLVSEGETPDWAVNPASYEFTMNVVGQLRIDNKLSEDTEDMVAAFNGKECVGVARPQYIKRYDAYYVMMNIYGNEDNDNDEISFKIYDASTGITYPSVCVTKPVTFEKDGIVGTVYDPEMWTPDNKVEQDIALNTGWNWLSLYVDPEDKTVGNVLKDVNASLLKTSNSYTQYAADTWTGELKEMSLGTMYKLQANEDGELQVIGTPVVSAETPIYVSKGWNWLGVATTATLSPAEAFGGLNPQEGDLVKSQREFSIYTENDWVGSLEAIVPGTGYLYSSEDATPKSFTYPKASSQGRKNAPRRVKANILEGSAIKLMENNMNVVLTVVDENGQQRSDAIVRVSAKGQLRGEAFAPNYGSEYFLTVQGKADDGEMQVSVQLDGITYNVGTIFFQQDALYGSIKQPVVIVIGETTAINSIYAASHNSNGSVYDLGGRRVSSDKLSNGQFNKGIYIYDRQKVVKK